MSNPFVPRVGGVLSADIAVPEHEREVRFYSRLLGTGRKPLWREDLMNNLGTPIIGLGQQSAEYAHLPLQWMPHIQVADISASVGHALDLGGTELMHSKDKWAVLLDPNGAAFGIIPVVPADAMPPTDDATTRTGHISWLDLTVSDASATCDFYRRVVGWSAQDIEMEDDGGRYVDYTLFGDDGNPAAGLHHARGASLDVPPVWMIHLPVGDLDESLRQAREGGGKVIKTTEGSDGEWVKAVIEDPVGACLTLVRV